MKVKKEDQMTSEMKKTESEDVRVLLIEDNPGDDLLLRQTLAEVKNTKFEVVSADRLKAGLDLLAKGDVDVVLLDLLLPDSRGLDTLHKVHSKISSIPVVVLTGLDDEAMAIEAVREGAQDYLIKGQTDVNLTARALRYAIERK